MAEALVARLGTGARKSRRIVLGWVLLGLAAFVLLPWYFPQNLTLWTSLPGVFGSADTASGLVQALAHGKPWLWCGAAGLAVALAAWRLPSGPAQGRVLVLGAGGGLAALLASGFGIGAAGWSFEFLEAWFGALPGGQFGIGAGGALVLLSLLMLLGAGIARLGYFRGDLFVAGAVVLCSALLLLFVALPVGKSLLGAFLDDAGQPSIAALAERLAHDLHGVLVGIGATEREEHAAALEPGELQQPLGQLRARPGAPGIGHEAQPLRLRADRGDDARVLVAEVAALGEAAHVEDRAAILEVQARAGAADHGRRVPLRLHAPAVQDRQALAAHDFLGGLRAGRLCAMRTNVRIAHHPTND